MDNIEFLETIIKGINPFTGEIITNASFLKAPDVIGRFEELLSELKKSNDFELVYYFENIEFLSAIIEGRNPVTNSELDNDDPLRVDYIVDCLKEIKKDYEIVKTSSISNDSDNLSSNDVEIEPHENNPNQYYGGIIFSNRIAIKITSPSITIQPFCKIISSAINNELSFNMLQNGILNFLLQDGKLEVKYSSKRRLIKYATSEGENIGISNEFIPDQYGKPTHRIYYSPNAQIYIIKNLSLIFH